MTVRRGEDWGEPGALAEDSPVFTEDGAAARFACERLVDHLSADGRVLEAGPT